MHLLLFAQRATSSPAPSVESIVQRMLLGELWTPPGSVWGLVGASVLWLAIFAIGIGFLQRDWKLWLRGIVDIRSHLDQFLLGLDLLRRNRRPLWVILLSAVVSWCTWSLAVWSTASNQSVAEFERSLVIHSNSAMSFASAHAFVAALPPMHGLLELGGLMALVLFAVIAIVGRTGNVTLELRSGMGIQEYMKAGGKLGTIWVGMIIVCAYRVVTSIANSQAAPAAGCLFIDALALPALLLTTDGLLLSWVLAEFGCAVRQRNEWHAEDTVAWARGLLPATVICGLSNPGRYIMLAAWMIERFRSSPSFPASSWGPALWVAALGQLFGLTLFAFPAVLVTCRVQGLAVKWRQYVTLLRRAGGQLIGLSAVAIVLSWAAMLPAYWLFGIMQPETWSLVGAASYGHYFSLIMSLVILGGVSQLAARELGVLDDPRPEPVLIRVPESEQRIEPVVTDSPVAVP